MDAVKFLEELKRMCAAYQGCEGCPLHMPNDRWRCKLSLSPVSWKTPSEEIYNAVEKWSAEHPVKTRLMELLEKYPNTQLDKYGAPSFLPASLGYCGRDDVEYGHCMGCIHEARSYKTLFCWNLPLEE